MSILNLIRDDLKSEAGYTANTECLPFRLHANELPWAPMDFNNIALNHYPGAVQAHSLKELLADYYEVQTEQLLLTRGSDEALDFLMRLFLQSRVDSIIQCPPTFSMYAFYARLQQAVVINCPLDTDDFSIALDHIKQSWQPGCKLIMICRPNNPTGNGIPLEDIRSLCSAFENKAIIVVDEAYIEFSVTQSSVILLSEFTNLIVLRTLSKAYGLAALRLGCIITQPDIIQALQGIIPPYTLSEVVIDLAQKALKDRVWFTTAIQTITSIREELSTQMQTYGFIEKVFPSEANFIMIKTPYAAGLASWLANHGIAIRAFRDSKVLQDCLRITVGDRETNAGVLNLGSLWIPGSCKLH